jgi:hypothetical protein
MFDINNSLTNKVVNAILINMINIMKVTLLLNDCNKQESLISESVTVIRIYFNPCKGTTLSTYHCQIFM